MNEMNQNGDMNNAPQAPVTPSAAVPETQNTMEGVNTAPISTGNDVLPEEHKKKSALPIVIVLLVVLLGVGGFFAYKMMSGNPIEKAFESVFKESKARAGKLYKESIDLTFDSDNKQLSFLKNYSINTEVSYDKDFNILMNGKLNEKGNLLLDMAAYMTKDKIYMKFPKLTNKTYYMSTESTTGTSINVESADMEYLVERFELALKNAFKEETVNKESKEVKLNSETVKVTYNYYKIDKTNSKRIATNFANTLEDEKTISILSKLTSLSASEIKEEFKSMKEDSEMDDDEVVKFGVYTQGLFNKFVGFEMSSNDSNMYYVENGDTGYGKGGADENNFFEVTRNGNNYTMDMTMEKAKVATMNFTMVNDNEFKMDIDIPNYFKVKANVKLTEISSLEKFDTANATDFSKMTQKDYTELSNKLTEVLKGSELYSIINGLFAQ